MYQRATRHQSAKIHGKVKGIVGTSVVQEKDVGDDGRLQGLTLPDQLLR